MKIKIIIIFILLQLCFKFVFSSNMSGLGFFVVFYYLGITYFFFFICIITLLKLKKYTNKIIFIIHCVISFPLICLLICLNVILLNDNFSVLNLFVLLSIDGFLLVFLALLPYKQYKRGPVKKALRKYNYVKLSKGNREGYLISFKKQIFRNIIDELIDRLDEDRGKKVSVYLDKKDIEELEVVLDDGSVFVETIEDGFQILAKMLNLCITLREEDQRINISILQE